VSGFGCQGVEGANTETYTIVKLHQANSRTAEYRILNVEGWNRFAQSILK